MATLAYRTVDDDMVVYVGADAAPDNAEWQRYVRHAVDVARRWRTQARLYKYFVFVDEGAPSATQRSDIWSAIKHTHVRAAVVTSGVLPRKVITAFGWLGAPMRGFSPRELVVAAEYLELELERLPLVVRTARALAPLVGGVRVVDEIPEDVLHAS